MKKKILIVDDDEEICEELAEILRDEGYAVETVSNGLAARSLIEKKVFHLLMLDLKIPEVTGVELLEFIRKKRLPLKVLVVTARPMGKQEIVQQKDSIVPDAKEQRLLKAADGIIPKPFDIPLLLARVKQLLRAA